MVHYRQQAEHIPSAERRIPHMLHCNNTIAEKEFFLPPQTH